MYYMSNRLDYFQFSQHNFFKLNMMIDDVKPLQPCDMLDNFASRSFKIALVLSVFGTPYCNRQI